MKLKDLKESILIEVAEYAVANRIVEEPAFKWWVPHTIRKGTRSSQKLRVGFGKPRTSLVSG